MSSEGAEAKRWSDEAAFFDTVAELGAGQLTPIDPAVLQRYGRPRWLDLYEKEFVYGLLGELHHLLHALPETLGALRRAARPGGRTDEPEPDAAPHPLPGAGAHRGHTGRTAARARRDRAPADLLPDLQMRHFNFLGRLNRFVLPCMQYERASLPRRLAADALALADAAILRVPGVESLGGIAVLWGHAPGG